MISALLGVALLGQAIASPAISSNQSATAACYELQKLLPGKVAMDPQSIPPSYQSSSSSSSSSSLSSLYNSTQQTYWDNANAFDFPACMVFPSCTAEVSTVIMTLNKFPGASFNLKSGGHNWNAGFSSTNGGVLVSFRPNLQNVTLSADKSVAEVGPGAKWKEVMAELNKHNRCAVGGRDGDVGVGGYVILGGISYLTGQYGLASDNVANFEAVLANGTVVNANATHNTDLYFSLRGGANNFAVITKYSLNAYPIGQIWGGTQSYTVDKVPQLISAIAKWTAKWNSTINKSHLLIGMISSPLVDSGKNQFTITPFWDGPVPPKHVFAEFDNITTVNGSKSTTQSYPTLLNSNSEVATIGRTTDRFGSFAFLPPDNMTEFLQWHYQQWASSPLHNDTKAGTRLFGMTWQPMPVDQQKARGVKVPGATAIDPAGGDKFWLEYSLAWTNASEDDRMTKALEEFVTKAQDYQKTKYAGVKPNRYQSGKLPDVGFAPLFANDAQTDQKIFESYGNETYNKMVETRKKYDPEQFFQKRSNGFKLELPQMTGQFN